MGERVQVVSQTLATPTTGSAGLRTQVPGRMTSVSSVANYSGGLGRGNLIESDR